MGNWTGTLAVRRRHAQSTLLPNRDLSEPQHWVVGEVPLPVLPVMKFMHGVKLVIIDAVHGVVICALIGVIDIARMNIDITVMHMDLLCPSMIVDWGF